MVLIVMIVALSSGSAVLLVISHRLAMSLYLALTLLFRLSSSPQKALQTVLLA